MARLMPPSWATQVYPLSSRWAEGTSTGVSRDQGQAPLAHHRLRPLSTTFCADAAMACSAHSRVSLDQREAESLQRLSIKHRKRGGD